MGAWGHTAFENDQALDWFGNNLEPYPTADTLAAAIEAVTSADSDDSVDAISAIEALAAAELVAAMLGKPQSDLHPKIAEWVAANPIPIEDDLISAAAAAVKRVAIDSELRDLWDEPNATGPWSESNLDLLRRLSR